MDSNDAPTMLKGVPVQVSSLTVAAAVWLVVKPYSAASSTGAARKPSTEPSSDVTLTTPDWGLQLAAAATWVGAAASLVGTAEGFGLSPMGKRHYSIVFLCDKGGARTMTLELRLLERQAPRQTFGVGQASEVSRQTAPGQAVVRDGEAALQEGAERSEDEQTGCEGHDVVRVRACMWRIVRGHGAKGV